MENEFVQALRDAMVFGVSLTAFITLLVQALKNRFGLEGEVVRFIALGLGALGGSLYLIFGFQPAPVMWYDYLWRILAAVVYSFSSPELYGLLKQTSIKAVEEIEEKATMDLGGEQPVG